MARPKTKPFVDESLLPKFQCRQCSLLHPITHFIKTKHKDENGENIRRTVCKHCTFGHMATGRDTQKLHLNAIRHRCKKKNMAFNLTYEDLMIPEFCPILNIPLQNWGQANESGAFNSPSVDKIIPALGYVKGNVQIISNRANLMKNDATIENIQALLAYMQKNIPQTITAS